MQQTTTGIIESGKFSGRKILLSKDKRINEKIWLVEDGLFANGAPIFQKACLEHEVFIPDNGCPKCDKGGDLYGF